MQQTVDAVSNSPHETSKVAATLVLPAQNDKDGAQDSASPSITQTNHWPESIEKTFGRGVPIGNSSGTLHAETACILKSTRPIEGATLYITDPPCPNCAKNIAESGVKTIYIDHKGFEKDFALRRGADIEDMSLRIFKVAGINVFKLWRKDRRIEPLITIAPDYKPPEENPPLLRGVSALDETIFRAEITHAARQYGKAAFALCLGHDEHNQPIAFCVTAHPTIGLSSADNLQGEGKYSFVLNPLNRLMMAAGRLGIRIAPDFIYMSAAPTARELVNFIGGGFDRLHITIDDGEVHQIDPISHAHKKNALNALQDADILTINPLTI
ncbi:MAG: deaminase [Alphaproteobacteria bacterium]